MEEKIKNDLKEALLARDEVKVLTLRLLISEIRNTQIQKGKPLSDEEIVGVIQKQLKQRKESAEAFRKGEREDLVQKEEKEASFLQNYLPAQLSDKELTKIITETIKESGASSFRDMGRVIGLVMTKVGQKADGARVAQITKESLS